MLRGIYIGEMKNLAGKIATVNMLPINGLCKAKFDEPIEYLEKKHGQWRKIDLSLDWNLFAASEFEIIGN